MGHVQSANNDIYANLEPGDFVIISKKLDENRRINYYPNVKVVNLYPSDISKIINDIMERSGIKRFIIHACYRGILSQARKKETKDLLVNIGSSVYMFDDGWDSPTFTTLILTANEANIHIVLALLFIKDIESFHLKDQYITFNTYVSELSKPKMDLRFDFCLSYSQRDGQSVGMQGTTKIVEPYEVFCSKYLKGKMR